MTEKYYIECELDGSWKKHYCYSPGDPYKIWMHYIQPRFDWIGDACREFYHYTQTIVGPILYKLSNAEYWKMEKTYITSIYMERRDDPGYFHDEPFIVFFAAPPNFYWISESLGAWARFQFNCSYANDSIHIYNGNPIQWWNWLKKGGV